MHFQRRYYGFSIVIYMKLEAKGGFQATKKQPKYAPVFLNYLQINSLHLFVFCLTSHCGLIIRTSLHMLEIAGSISPGGDLDSMAYILQYILAVTGLICITNLLHTPTLFFIHFSPRPFCCGISFPLP